ncbi:MAG: heavy-metal-associated domain-containing protein [Chloroflexi bacterium]|uniref:Cation transporter n=1 Tax=Candidatus Chlorohelix allophototropha TaxID=3003348 RepID=A0A8T7M369_9CHLR|nr:heavy-metal-associated domain-containing protein [Chloroflexota bacterium]WJW67308.1 cation transporter [Chloroflexota bacterium L227-S17]
MKKEVTYDVPGVSCQHCVNSITTAATGLGVNDVQVDLTTKKVYLVFDTGSVDEVALKAAIEEEGYDIAGETPGKAFNNPNEGKKSLKIV